MKDTDLVSRILAGAQQMDLADLVGEEKPFVGKASDRYMTSEAVLRIVAAQFGSIDLDPAWDPECLVEARTCFDVRAGQDGLVLPWHGRVWLNPPYSAPAAWLARAAQHGAAGGEVLALVPASTGSRTWTASVWAHASVCFLAGRPKFRRVGSSKWSEHVKDCAVLYYSSDPASHYRFGSVWAPHGHVELRPDLPRPGRGVDLPRKP